MRALEAGEQERATGSVLSYPPFATNRLIAAIEADAIKAEDMIGHVESPGLGDFLLASFDVIIAEFFHPATAHAYDVIMMVAMIQFKDRLVALEVVPFDQSRRFKLGQNTVNRSQANLSTFLYEAPVQFLGRQMPFVIGTGFQQFQNLDSWRRNLESRVLDIPIFHRSNLGVK